MHPSLIPLAFEYALAYEGDAEFLHNAHVMALQCGCLTLPVAQRVFDCICADPAWQERLPMALRTPPKLRLVKGSRTLP